MISARIHVCLIAWQGKVIPNLVWSWLLYYVLVICNLRTSVRDKTTFGALLAELLELQTIYIRHRRRMKFLDSNDMNLLL